MFQGTSFKHKTMAYKDKEYAKARMKEYRLAKKEAESERIREWKNANKEHIKIQSKAYNETNKEKIAAKKREYYLKNKERIDARNSEYNQKNKNALLQKRSEWLAKTPGLSASYVKKYQASKLQRTPAWLTDFDKLKMSCIYSVAAMLTKHNNEPWHVDHIIPLQGEIVSGLHVPNNLRVMRGSENISKSNRVEVNNA